MSLRTIMIFPEFKNVDIINGIRRKYDPLADLVAPHITLVFPFNSELTNEELRLYLKDCLKGMKPFKVDLEGFSKKIDSYGNYLFLNVVYGMDLIKAIHEKLYKGMLKEFDLGYYYVPHMTAGKLSSAELLDKAFDDVNKNNYRFSTIIDKITVEMIGEHEESSMIFEHKLN